MNYINWLEKKLLHYFRGCPYVEDSERCKKCRVPFPDRECLKNWYESEEGGNDE